MTVLSGTVEARLEYGDFGDVVAGAATELRRVGGDEIGGLLTEKKSFIDATSLSFMS